MPSPKKIDTPMGSQVPQGYGNCDRGAPSRRPASRPTSRPMTAVTNSAVDISWTRLSTQVAGTIVRYGRIANPRTSHETVQAATSAPWVGEPEQQAPPHSHTAL